VDAKNTVWSKYDQKNLERDRYGFVRGDSLFMRPRRRSRSINSSDAIRAYCDRRVSHGNTRCRCPDGRTNRQHSRGNWLVAISDCSAGREQRGRRRIVEERLCTIEIPDHVSVKRWYGFKDEVGRTFSK
jgi:hypothetical protein